MREKRSGCALIEGQRWSSPPFEAGLDLSQLFRHLTRGRITIRTEASGSRVARTLVVSVSGASRRACGRHQAAPRAAPRTSRPTRRGRRGWPRTSPGPGRPGSKEPGRGSFAPDIFGPPVGLAALLDHGVGDRHQDGDHDPLDADADHESDDEAGQKLDVAVEKLPTLGMS